MIRENPARLVSVGSKEDFSDVRICCEIDPNESYMTLSHRWTIDGGPVKLLEDNIHEYTKGLPWERLPLVFKDAVNVVRELSEALDVRFIWIDALCIIQDSTADKQKELTKMSSIYRHSLCNLAACLGEGNQIGLLQDHYSTLNLHECVLQVDPKNPESIRVRLDHWDLYTKAVTNSNLNSRSWVLQELFLAPRVIYFTPQQLIWECTRGCRYQASPQEVRNNTERNKPYTPIPPKIANEQDGLEDRDIAIYQLWADMIANYSKREMTYESDKLDAISAIARTAQALLEQRDEYVLGLWRKQLDLGILWVVSGHGQVWDPSEIPEARRPSWSWISAHGPLTNIHNVSTQRLVTLVPHVKYVNENNPFGDASFAELEATGIIAKLPLYVYYDAESQGGKVFAACTLPGRSAEDNELLKELFTAEFSVFIGRPEKEQSVFLWGYCLFVAWEPSFWGQLTGLILSRLKHGRGLYRRIGTFVFRGRRWEGLPGEIATQYSLDEDDFIERNHDGSYRVTIL